MGESNQISVFLAKFIAHVIEIYLVCAIIHLISSFCIKNVKTTEKAAVPMIRTHSLTWDYTKKRGKYFISSSSSFT